MRDQGRLSVQHWDPLGIPRTLKPCTGSGPPLDHLGAPSAGHGQTHSLSRGMDVLLLLFWTMLAWFLKEMRIMAGANRQGSPSTCMGMDLYVSSMTSRHWCSLSPWPPTCRAACKREIEESWELLPNSYSGELQPPTPCYLTRGFG